MKKNLQQNILFILTSVSMMACLGSCSNDDIGNRLDDITNNNTSKQPLIYKPGTDVRLTNKAEYCQSVIADGKELITGTERGAIRVAELKDPKVYITFKQDITDFSDVFLGCENLTGLSDNLFANNESATDFTGAFLRCSSLTTIPKDLFANNKSARNFSWLFFNCKELKEIPSSLFSNNPEVTDFSFAFYKCTSLTGESPYTMVDGMKVHLYERKDYPEHFTAPATFEYAFSNCTGLTDYRQMPYDWKY